MTGEEGEISMTWTGRFDALSRRDTFHAVGLMSGTSCDGVDAALVRITDRGDRVETGLIAFETAPYPEDLRFLLLRAPDLDAREICLLDAVLGEAMAGAAGRVIEDGRASGVIPDFVASHGHTVAHFPSGARADDGASPLAGAAATLQIGSPAILAERTGLDVIADFRPRDMALGGQGAPLVPLADWLQFHGEDETRLALNVGGIANVTVITPGLDGVIAFDTGPGNMLIDGIVARITKGRLSMDRDGNLASRGLVLPGLLERFLDHPFLDQVPPRSAGRENFGVLSYLAPALDGFEDESLEDLAATATEAVARTVIGAITRFVHTDPAPARMGVSGGGARNPELMKRLAELARARGVIVEDAASWGIPGDAREAVAFAVLGLRTLKSRAGNVPRATGAEAPAILGSITPGGG